MTAPQHPPAANSPTQPPATPDESSPEPYPDYPHFATNYRLGIANGVLFNTGLSFFHSRTIIPDFLNRLGAPSIVIAATSLFETIGWHLPQFLASRYVVHRPLKLPLYRMAAIIRMICVGVAIAAPLLYGFLPSSWVLTIFVLGFGAFALAGGFAGLVFMELVAKTCPPQKRGSYFSWRAILGNITAAMLGVVVVGPIIGAIAFPYQYMTLFVIGAVVIGVSFYVFALQKEPPTRDLPPKRSMRQHIGHARGIFSKDRTFRNLVILRGVLMVWLAGTPFYFLFARERFGFHDAEIGWCIAAELGGSILANMLWGYISNRIGNRILLVIAATLATLLSITLLLFDAGFLPWWLFFGVFAASASAESSAGTGGINYALEIVPEGERPTFVGAMNTLLAFACGVAVVVGGLRDVIGYTGLFGFTTAIGVIALALAVQLKEPRKTALATR
ncbi:MAG: MFS transporter [Candidatus Kapabacteria bacterium]|nr:MFS transporter [Candidatus Kapabacteria bacterium]